MSALSGEGSDELFSLYVPNFPLLPVSSLAASGAGQGSEPLATIAEQSGSATLDAPKPPAPWVDAVCEQVVAWRPELGQPHCVAIVDNLLTNLLGYLLTLLVLIGLALRRWHRSRNPAPGPIGVAPSLQAPASASVHPLPSTRGHIAKGVRSDDESFNVFLSHNSRDKPTVRQLAKALQARGLKVWLDEEQLVPGRPWQDALEQIIQTAHTAAVLVGKDGLGPWEDPEMRACLSEFVQRRMPVIPVLLPDAPVEPKLPLFLRTLTWVDLRGGLTDHGLDRLEWGITAIKPNRSPSSLQPRHSVGGE